MKPMTLIACSDLHGIASFESVADRAIYEKANVVVVAGDVQTAFAGRDPRTSFSDDFLRHVWKLEKVGIEVILTPGNHDFYLRGCLGKENRKRFMSNLHILCDKRLKMFDLKFYGTPWVPTINGRWCYEADDEDLEPMFRKIPKGLDVLIAHSPPLGNEGEFFDVSMGDASENWEHYGSAALRRAIEEKKPRLVICGHIHTGDHHICRIGETTLVNVSLIDEGYNEAYLPTVIRLDGKGELKFKIGGEDQWKTYRSSCI